MCLITGGWTLSKDWHFLVIETLQLIVILLIPIWTEIFLLIIYRWLVQIEAPWRLILLFLLKLNLHLVASSCWTKYFTHSHAILVGNTYIISIISSLLLLVSHYLKLLRDANGDNFAFSSQIIRKRMFDFLHHFWDQNVCIVIWILVIQEHGLFLGNADPNALGLNIALESLTLHRWASVSLIVFLFHSSICMAHYLWNQFMDCHITDLVFGRLNRVRCQMSLWVILFTVINKWIQRAAPLAKFIARISSLHSSRHRVI